MNHGQENDILVGSLPRAQPKHESINHTSCERFDEFFFYSFHNFSCRIKLFAFLRIGQYIVSLLNRCKTGGVTTFIWVFFADKRPVGSTNLHPHFKRGRRRVETKRERKKRETSPFKLPGDIVRSEIDPIFILTPQ